MVQKNSYISLSTHILLSSLPLITFALQTLIRYILRQDLPSSLDDSLMLAAAYKFPTPQIHYFYIVQLTTQGKVGKRIPASENDYISSFPLCVFTCVHVYVPHPDRGMPDSPEEVVPL